MGICQALFILTVPRQRRPRFSPDTTPTTLHQRPRHPVGGPLHRPRLVLAEVKPQAGTKHHIQKMKTQRPRRKAAKPAKEHDRKQVSNRRAEVLSVAKKSFGFEELRPGQEEPILSLLA